MPKPKNRAFATHKVGTTTHNEGQKKPLSKKLHHPPRGNVKLMSDRVDAKKCVGCGMPRTSDYPICSACASRNPSPKTRSAA